MKSSAVQPMLAQPARPPIAANHLGSSGLPLTKSNATRTVMTISPAAGS
jgi:hypothetical protein